MGERSTGARLIALWVGCCLWLLGVPVGGWVGVASAASSPSDVGQVPSLPEPAASGLRAAILPFLVEGELTEADRQILADALMGGLQRGDFAVVEPAATVKASSDAKSCAKKGCYKKIARATKSSHVVRAKVTIVDRDYSVEVKLVDGETGAVLATSRDGCEICGISDASNLVSTAAATLRTKLDALAQGPATVEIVSAPSDADVVVGGELFGTTPLRRPVLPGKQVIRVSKPGFISVEREVTFVEGVDEKLSFELEKVPSRLPSRPWGWVSLGAGIVAIGTSIGFAIIDDRPFEVGDACSGGNQDTDGECRRLWNTQYIVLSTALVGAALTTLGIAILVDSSRRRRGRAKASKAEQVRFKVGLGSLSGRF